MELIQANEAIFEELQSFVTKNRSIDVRTLANEGYVIRIPGKIIGCFVLEKQSFEDRWLKQLFIEREEAARLPYILEAILLLAREQQTRQVHVHSHQPALDILLEALQFSPQESPASSGQTGEKIGNWWIYQVC
ncbi:hypothetical protein QR721_11330 [Aciduricibacillus chroicocephali]|uniref:N-acetyltransferase domain-containing protein n=1 Tax=Aciduricibacillus chroicocephali TaxID=3054939 RepID=A0ABY9KU06_9BACI|nr:hypothetical protein QR721_11330 [Bacillaceae bacterium 44XB]